MVISDARMLRALAHPARITVLHHLFAGEVLTATEFAQIAGLTASAMSYHLRALEKQGLIGRAEPAGDGRERPWRAVGRSIRIDAGTSVAAHAAKDQVFASLVDLLRTDLTAALAGPAGSAPRPDPEADLEADPDPGQPSPGQPSPGRGTAPMGFTVMPLTLTDDEAQQIMAKLAQLLGQRPQSQTPREGTRRYHGYWALLPLDQGASGAEPPDKLSQPRSGHPA